MGTTIHHEVIGLPNTFILVKIGNSHLRMVDLSNAYSRLSQVIYAFPDEGWRVRPQGYMLYDYYNVQQWQIRKVIGRLNDSTVWDFARVGRNVLVAVVDDGVEAHEDLDSIRVDLGYDFAEGDTCAAPTKWSFHGMAIAGIIGAKHTTDPNQQGRQNTGIISMNPHARIIPIKITFDDGWPMDPSYFADAIGWAWQHGAQVINFSWDFVNPYADVPSLDSALLQAYQNGRGGKGTPVIVPAGDAALWFPGLVDYPGNQPQCLAVGSVNSSDQRYPWSMYGEELHVVTPSGDTSFAGDLWSLDRMGTLGLNPTLTQFWGTEIDWNCEATKDTGNNTNYDCHYGGTSASGAIVSGIASLLISKDSNLTAAQIYNIIDSSAVGPGSEEIGHGRADAFRAILSVSHGDANNDGVLNLGDLTALANYLTGGGFVPFPSPNLGDWNCDGAVDLGDLSAMVNYFTGEGTPPKKPCFVF